MTATTRDKGHGRCERRTLKATTALNGYLDWPGSCRWARRERGRQGREDLHRCPLLHHQRPPVGGGAGQLLAWVRGHWSIEDRSHDVRDVTMERTRAGSARVPVPR